MEHCSTLEDFVAVTFDQQCGPAARAAGVVAAPSPGITLDHGGKLLSTGLRGDFELIVRWLKFIYAHRRQLLQLCETQREATLPALGLLSHSLAAPCADAVLWGARLLTHVATRLTVVQPQMLADWFDAQGLAALVGAWRTHPDLHAIGSLLPLVPPCIDLGPESRLLFFTSTLPSALGDTTAYLSFTLEVMPLLHAADVEREEPACDKTLLYLVQLGLAALREGSEVASTRSLALELLAQLWSLYPEDLEALPMAAPRQPFEAAGTEGEGEAEAGGASGSTSAAVILRALRDATRRAEMDVQVTALTAMVQLFDGFADKEGAEVVASSALFRALGFALLENYHDVALRVFLQRSLSQLLARHPSAAVGSLLRPLLKQAANHGYSNVDFDFYLSVAAHEGLESTHAVQLLQFLADVSVRDALLGRAASVPLLVVVDRFLRHEPLILDYLEVFTESALARLLPEAGGKEASPVAATLVLETLAKLLRVSRSQWWAPHCVPVLTRHLLA